MLRPGLRIALVVGLLAFGGLPAAGAILMSASAKHEEAQSDLDARLADVALTAQFQMGNDLERFRQILLTSARNPAFVEVARDPEHASFWTQQVNLALLQLTTTFPGMIDEACRIAQTGVELGRVVKGEVASDGDLSQTEANDNPAFWPTMALPEGGVHYQAAYLSPDTQRWVLAAATPLYADDQPYGILHFEVPLAYYYRDLKSALPADGFLAVASADGRVYLDTTAPEPNASSLTEVSTLFADLELDGGAPAVMTGETGFANWTKDGLTYRVRYQTTEPVAGMSMTVLVGLPAAPGFSQQLEKLLLPVGLGALSLLVLALVVANALTRLLVVVAPSSAAAAAPRRRRLAGAFIVVLAMLFAAGVAVGLGVLRHGATEQRQREIVLARLEGDVRQLDNLADGDPVAKAGLEATQGADEVRQHVMQGLADVARLDEQGSLAQLLDLDFAHYAADLAQLERLVAEGREAEAHLWHLQRAHASLATLASEIQGSSAAARASADRLDIVVDVGSAVALVLSALVMGLLAWRFTRTRRVADLLATEKHALRRSEDRFRKLVQQGAELVAILDTEGTVRYCSPSAATLLGHPAENLVGTGLYARVHPEDMPVLRRLLHDAVVELEGSTRAEFRLRHADGSWRHVEALCRNLLADADINGFVLNARDITERKALESELAYRAYHDVLTELPNRALLVDRLDQALARGARTGSAAAVLFIDLDEFKDVNDSLGHRLGDQLLVAVAQRLRACLRPGDTAARLGGDEFVVVLEDLTGVEDAVALAERFLEDLRVPVSLEGCDVFASASIGIAMTGADGALTDDLLRDADVAMYAAKGRGRGEYAIFEQGMNAGLRERRDLEADLRRALERSELVVYYQPILDLASERITGVEALVRWAHPVRGLVSPGEFIPLAEETGLIVPIGRWVLEQACRQARAWHVDFPSATPLVMSVNLSSRQFQQPGLVEDVARTLRSTGIPPHTLKLEITESLAMEAGIGTIQKLQSLKGLGVLLAIDDFGTGYSSLAQLKRFPVDTLKLDKSFVDGLGKDAQDTAIVQSVLALARILGLSVTAEGVETIEQLDELRSLRCDDAQGYLFARPQSSDALTGLFQERLTEARYGRAAA